MNSLLNDFKICDKIPPNYKINIKSFYVFNNYYYYLNKLNKNPNIIFETKEDKVYCLGANNYGTLGLGHNGRVIEVTEIEELLKLKITDIFNGCSHVFCKSEDNKLFGWGKNDCGQLGLGDKSAVNCYLKPQEIIFFRNETIKDICCGVNHTLVLLSNGLLYGWGYNKYGQLGLNQDEIVVKPKRLKITDENDLKFRYIYCFGFSSFAITLNGELYSWGYNENGLLGQGIEEQECIPREIKLNNIVKVQYIFNDNERRGYSYFMTNSGSIYFCGNGNQASSAIIVPIKIENFEFKGFSQYNGYKGKIGLCYDNDQRFYSFENSKLKFINMNYATEIEVFAKHFEVTSQMLHISHNGVWQVWKNNSGTYSIKLDETSIYNLVNKEFERHSLIGKGGFGEVNKYKNTVDKKFYAIKIINIPDALKFSPDFIREVEIMSNIKSHFVVQYNNSWIKNDYLFIQMEYCLENLKQTLENKSKCFERNEKQAMNSVEYFISCEIFRQITEALNYLHSLKPNPVIHRDLKPENILIGMSDNKRICKLADFGLSKFIEGHSEYHTRGAGTQYYMAPEVDNKQHKYDTKADVFSLGRIGLELFDLNISNVGELYQNSKFAEKIIKCEDIIDTKLIIKKNRRLSSKELLEIIPTFNIDKEIMKNEENFDYFLKKCSEEYNYFHDILDVLNTN